MYTLVYLNGRFNRPKNLESYLLSNIGLDPMLQIDCVTPYTGTANELTDELCDYLDKINQKVEVTTNVIINQSTEKTKDKLLVHYLVVQLSVKQRD